MFVDKTRESPEAAVACSESYNSEDIRKVACELLARFGLVGKLVEGCLLV